MSMLTAVWAAAKADESTEGGPSEDEPPEDEPLEAEPPEDEPVEDEPEVPAGLFCRVLPGCKNLTIVPVTVLPSSETCLLPRFA